MISSTLRRFSISSRCAGPSQTLPAIHDRFMRWWRPSIRLSSTVIAPNSSMFWNVRAMPDWAIRYGFSPMMSSPCHRICPCCGRYTPFRQLKIDVFPAPFGPMIENSSPSSTWKDTPSIAFTPSKLKCTSRKSRSRSVTRETPFHQTRRSRQTRYGVGSRPGLRPGPERRAPGGGSPHFGEPQYPAQ